MTEPLHFGVGEFVAVGIAIAIISAVAWARRGTWKDR